MSALPFLPLPPEKGCIALASAATPSPSPTPATGWNWWFPEDAGFSLYTGPGAHVEDYTNVGLALGGKLILWDVLWLRASGDILGVTPDYLNVFPQSKAVSPAPSPSPRYSGFPGVSLQPGIFVVVPAVHHWLGVSPYFGYERAWTASMAPAYMAPSVYNNWVLGFRKPFKNGTWASVELKQQMLTTGQLGDQVIYAYVEVPRLSPMPPALRDAFLEALGLKCLAASPSPSPSP